QPAGRARSRRVVALGAGAGPHPRRAGRAGGQGRGRGGGGAGRRGAGVASGGAGTGAAWPRGRGAGRTSCRHRCRGGDAPRHRRRCHPCRARCGHRRRPHPGAGLVPHRRRGAARAAGPALISRPGTARIIGAPPPLTTPMDPRLKQRLIGAAVLVALAVIFLPMLVKGPAPDSGVSDLSLDLPDRPRDSGTVTRDLPLVAPRPRPDDGALGLGANPRPGNEADDGSLPTVDTAAARHPDAAQLAGEDPAPEPDLVAGSGEPGDVAEAADEPRQEPEAALPPTTAGGDYAVRFGS